MKEQRPEANPGEASGGSHGGAVRDQTKHTIHRPRLASLMRGAMWWIDRWRQSDAYKQTAKQTAKQTSSKRPSKRGKQTAKPRGPKKDP